MPDSLEHLQHEATLADHFGLFEDFCRAQMSIGRVVPSIVGYLTEGLPIAEKFWRALCYIAVYNVAGGEVIWREWPLLRAQTEDDEIYRWVVENWESLPFRKERRPVRTRVKLTTFLLKSMQWASIAPYAPWWNTSLSPVERYEAVWEDVLRIPYLGRYMALKMVEFIHQFGPVEMETPDIRAKGGWSPRSALTLLYPEAGEYLMGNDSPGNLAVVNGVAEAEYQRLLTCGVPFDRYYYQALLCEYKQAWVHGKHYAGRAHDSEMRYAFHTEQYWPRSGLWEAREALFPLRVLGEHSGWTGSPRVELLPLLREHQYVWCDLKDDYLKFSEMSFA